MVTLTRPLLSNALFPMVVSSSEKMTVCIDAASRNADCSMVVIAEISTTPAAISALLRRIMPPSSPKL